MRDRGPSGGSGDVYKSRGLGGESVTANVLKDFGNILAQLVQFRAMVR
ncbi:hypothetical protein HpBGD68_15040 [Helicobacter pylori]